MSISMDGAQRVLRKSRVLREIKAGSVATCAKLSISDPKVVELCGLAGYSTVWLCMEHVPTDWSEIENCIRAAKIYDMDVVVRVARGSYSDYVRPLECDAAGIMVPHIETAKEAEQIVRYCRFFPVGRRALDGGNVDGAYCQVPVEEYIRHANSERFLILQIESPEAVANADEIAAVPGYEFLLFGPGDYAHRIGKAGQYNCEEVNEARVKVERAALKHGKRCFSVGLPFNRTELVRRGYHICSIASDVLGLGAYLSNQLAFEAGSAPEDAVESVYSIPADGFDASLSRVGAPSDLS